MLDSGVAKCDKERSFYWSGKGKKNVRLLACPLTKSRIIMLGSVTTLSIGKSVVEFTAYVKRMRGSSHPVG